MAKRFRKAIIIDIDARVEPMSEVPEPPRKIPMPITPPPPPLPCFEETEPVCEHEYTVLHSESTQLFSGGEVAHEKIIASFYCKKCLDIRAVTKTMDNGSDDE